MARFERDAWFPARVADAHEIAGDWARAGEQRCRVCTLDPDVAEHNLGLACAIAELGELDAAADAARRALALDPSLTGELPRRPSRVRAPRRTPSGSNAAYLKASSPTGVQVHDGAANVVPRGHELQKYVA